MATKQKTPIQHKAKTEAEVGTGLEGDKGYGGTGDYATGKVEADPSQATVEQIKANREKFSG